MDGGGRPSVLARGCCGTPDWRDAPATLPVRWIARRTAWMRADEGKPVFRSGARKGSGRGRVRRRMAGLGGEAARPSESRRTRRPFYSLGSTAIWIRAIGRDWITWGPPPAMWTPPPAMWTPPRRVAADHVFCYAALQVG
jgi:hypothetical protein